jgi:hypothetical protein
MSDGSPVNHTGLTTNLANWHIKRTSPGDYTIQGSPDKAKLGAARQQASSGTSSGPPNQLPSTATARQLKQLDHAARSQGNILTHGGSAHA